MALGEDPRTLAGYLGDCEQAWKEGRHRVRNRRTYEDYEEMGRYLEAAQEAVGKAMSKSFDMFGGLDPVTDDRAPGIDRRPRPTSYDEKILAASTLLESLRSELAMNFQVEIPESEVPAGKPRTPSPFDREDR